MDETNDALHAARQNILRRCYFDKRVVLQYPDESGIYSNGFYQNSMVFVSCDVFLFSQKKQACH